MELHEKRLAALVGAGLCSVQLSVQHADPAASERIAGARSFAAKVRAARLVREADLPLGLNVVLHRDNLGSLDALIELGLAWGAERIELANTQFYGWALRNRDLGGCRYQAYALTGDATRTDPVCSLAPDHALVRDLVDPTHLPDPAVAPPRTSTARNSPRPRSRGRSRHGRTTRNEVKET